MVRVISGPTGSGKSRLAEELAGAFKLDVVNADAFQFYREIPILSAQPEKILPHHHFISHLSVVEPWNAGDFSRASELYLNRPSIWVGTGLYMGAALWGLDPERVKGTPFQGKPRVDFKMIVLDPDRKTLYERLEVRVDQMIERGALHEVELLKNLRDSQKISERHPLLKTIGVRQLLSHLDKIHSYDEAIRLWKRDTRRLAKRQWTWLRKFSPPSPRVQWMTYLNFEDLEDRRADIERFFSLGSP